MELDTYIRHIPGFPKEGILFHDITPLLLDGSALRYSVDRLAEFAKAQNADLSHWGRSAWFHRRGCYGLLAGPRFRYGTKAGQAPRDRQSLRVRPGVRH